MIEVSLLHHTNIGYEAYSTSDIQILQIMMLIFNFYIIKLQKVKNYPAHGFVSGFDTIGGKSQLTYTVENKTKKSLKSILKNEHYQ